MARTKQRVIKHDMGAEPTKIVTQSDLIRAYQWYNYEYTIKQGRKFLTAYAKKNLTKKEQALLESLKDSQVSPTVLWQARMIEQGTLPQDSKAFFAAKLLEMVEAAKGEKPKVVIASIKKPAVQDRIRAQVSEWIANIEDEIDLLGDKVKTEFSPYAFLQKVEAKPVHINPMVTYYSPIRDEVAEAVAGTDDQLNEAYGYLSKAALKRLLAFYENLISDFERVINNRKVVRKPHKRKVKSADQITKLVKYLPESNEHKIVSVDPEKMVGATQVWLFNVKYNQLSVYNALTGGLTVKGTTLQNFDPDTSLGKRVRKTEEALEAVKKNGKVALRKLIDTFKTKATEGTGRINKDTIIVRVV
jgi:hypothetical protein